MDFFKDNIIDFIITGTTYVGQPANKNEYLC